MTRRVIPLPWWPCQLGCGKHAAVVLWRGQVLCRCQLSHRDKCLLAHDVRLDGEDVAQPKDIRRERRAA